MKKDGDHRTERELQYKFITCELIVICKKKQQQYSKQLLGSSLEIVNVKVKINNVAETMALKIQVDVSWCVHTGRD